MCAVLPPECFTYGSVGLIMPSVEIKLKDVPEAGYLSTNTPPQGEVLIRGPSVIGGYYKRDDLNTDESIFTKDGWLRTGDVGQFNADGIVYRGVSCRLRMTFNEICFCDEVGSAHRELC